MKKLLSVLLTIVLLISAVPLGAFSLTVSAMTDGYYTYTITADGKVTITDVDTSISGDITIPSTLGGLSVAVVGYDAFDSCNSITSIIIPDSVTGIGIGAFKNCKSLTSVVIGSGVVSIQPDAFRFCSSLIEINVDENNNKFCSIDGVLFNKEITVLKLYPAAKKDISYTIPDSVTLTGWHAFDHCTNLTSITFPEGLTGIGDFCFINCTSLKIMFWPLSLIYIGTDDPAFIGTEMAFTDIWYEGGEEDKEKLDLRTTMK